MLLPLMGGLSVALCFCSFQLVCIAGLPQHVLHCNDDARTDFWFSIKKYYLWPHHDLF